MSYNSIRGISPTCEFKNGFVEKLCRFEFPMKTGNDHISIEMCSPVDYLKKIDQMAETKSGAYAEEVGRMVREFVSNLSPDTAYDRRWEKLMHDTQSSQNPQGKFALGAVLGALSPVHADLCDYLARLDKRARKLERAIADHKRCATDEATRRAHFRQILLQEHADVEVVLSRLTGLVEAEKSVPRFVRRNATSFRPAKERLGGGSRRKDESDVRAMPDADLESRRTGHPYDRFRTDEAKTKLHTKRQTRGPERAVSHERRCFRCINKGRLF
ncbi:hypothetical protein CYMTET_38597 [Cymbomonas tetramitiformis]|uniref:Uncharacterized protein n=1 Tax=Cymbomonas tetramitiformis TaxID=36881 RepID=A0AAE0F5A0_9CHLO|nr:hypothetical protein CYMTET_38597 [Cymbomonas tetramitiformis]